MGMDADDDGTVSRAEFLEWVLIETGKCDKKFLKEANDTFEELDKDSSETLTIEVSCLAPHPFLLICWVFFATTSQDLYAYQKRHQSFVFKQPAARKNTKKKHRAEKSESEAKPKKRRSDNKMVKKVSKQQVVV